MEWAGVRVDSAELASQARELSSQLAEIEEQAYELAGERFNLSSPMQVGEILFGKLGLDKNAKRTKKGGYSTTEEVLEKHRASHPVVGLILRARALKKLLTTYVRLCLNWSTPLPERFTPLSTRLLPQPAAYRRPIPTSRIYRSVPKRGAGCAVPS